MNAVPSLDAHHLYDRNSTYIIRVKGKRQRLNLKARDLLIVNRDLPFAVGKIALVVVKNRFQIQEVTEEFLNRHDPDAGDFIWGMVQTVVRELE